MTTTTAQNNDISPAILLLGPTGIGKTELSLTIAEKFSCEIVSVDSMQVYRYMDIGTAKATPEERSRVPHHLIDIVDPDEEYHVARFIEDATQASKTIMERDKFLFWWEVPVFILKGYWKGFLKWLEQMKLLERNSRSH